ncbi:hypothetical protein LTS18_005354, partial [Coniosporium uncinatum]
MAWQMTEFTRANLIQSAHYTHSADWLALPQIISPGQVASTSVGNDIGYLNLAWADDLQRLGMLFPARSLLQTLTLHLREMPLYVHLARSRQHIMRDSARTRESRWELTLSACFGAGFWDNADVLYCSKLKELRILFDDEDGGVASMVDGALLVEERSGSARKVKTALDDCFSQDDRTWS